MRWRPGSQSPTNAAPIESAGRDGETVSAHRVSPPAALSGERIILTGLWLTLAQ